MRAAAAEPRRIFLLDFGGIKRGNPAQIPGELLSLSEATERYLEEALRLARTMSPDERAFVDENL